jgi:hypothetical protein
LAVGGEKGRMKRRMNNMRKKEKVTYIRQTNGILLR